MTKMEMKGKNGGDLKEIHNILVIIIINDFMIYLII